MDENQVEETETASFGAFVNVLSTAAAVGFVAGVGFGIGREVTSKAQVKIQELRKARAAKKAAQTES